MDESIDRLRAEGYDLIGDIHGYASALERLLTRLGYRPSSGVWRHPTRRVIFLGDFVDRGPEQVRTVAIARAMVEADCALAVMGNHEFNAVAWATPHPGRRGQFLRPHTAKNLRQHNAYLEQIGAASTAHAEQVAWFRSLPLYLDLDGFRVIHACWHQPSLEVLAAHIDDQRRIRTDAWPALTQEGTAPFEALETILKGLEIPLPSGASFHDKDGNPRHRIRTRWWDFERLTYRDLALVPADAIEHIPHEPIPAHVQPGYDGKKPLFVGHYWLVGTPRPLTDQIACLDYSIAAQDSGSNASGKLCAYRWSGERELSADRMVWVAGTK